MPDNLKLTDRRRVDALAQLKKAQEHLAEGRRELAEAQVKIDLAQSLIDESAKTLRNIRGRKPR